MLTARGAAARWAAAVAACAVAVLPALAATPAGADVVRDQELWVLDMVHAPQAWNLTRGQGVTVAVIDSGVFPSVSDLAGSVIGGPDLSGVRTPMTNPAWGVHGTWMASLIAGHGHAGGSSGIIGVAPAAKVLSIRVVTDRGDPHFRAYQHESNADVQQALATAITDATARGAQVISMSLGYGAASRQVRLARRDGQAPYYFPADYPGVLGVGAVGPDGRAASFSSDNLSVEVAAPGVRVPAQGRDGQYWLVSGTSPACAIVSGIAALVRARYPHLPVALADQAITGTAQHAPPGGYDDRVGFGTVDAAAALATAGRLSRDSAVSHGVRLTAHFGGGPAAVPPVPVPVRGKTALAVYALLALCCLAVAGFAAAGLRRTRRSRGTRGIARGSRGTAGSRPLPGA